MVWCWHWKRAFASIIELYLTLCTCWLLWQNTSCQWFQTHCSLICSFNVLLQILKRILQKISNKRFIDMLNAVCYSFKYFTTLLCLTRKGLIKYDIKRIKQGWKYLRFKSFILNLNDWPIFLIENETLLSWKNALLIL